MRLIASPVEKISGQKKPPEGLIVILTSNNLMHTIGDYREALD